MGSPALATDHSVQLQVKQLGVRATLSTTLLELYLGTIVVRQLDAGLLD